MDLDGLKNFLQTQVTTFTSVIKYTENLDPVKLKLAINQHHARMLAAAASRCPIAANPASTSLGKGKITPVSASALTLESSLGKHAFTEIDSTSDDDYEIRSKAHSSLNTARRRTSSATPTRKLKKNTNFRSKIPASLQTSTTSSGGDKVFGSAGKGQLFTISPNGMKTYNPPSDSEESESSEVLDKEGTCASTGSGDDRFSFRDESARGSGKKPQRTHVKKSTMIKASKDKGDEKNKSVDTASAAERVLDGVESDVESDWKESPSGADNNGGN
ncbi:hypothetical protein QTJ16_004159 [Diplocarpon rosae]|uniref:Uncharacterized protein n=1 Tax=Diplocarpon rosae TaxID=946125 RepID=A0AAD9T1F5_9HELO|nr:hypothetical protein QTJ16_004159 [Diplocarpon rosae]